MDEFLAQRLQLIEQYKGGHRGVDADCAPRLSRETVTRQRTYAENLEAPADQFLPWAVYKKRFGALSKHAGHQRRRINGIDGVVIPADEAEGWKLQRVYGSSVNKDTKKQTDIASVAHAPGSTGACGVPCTAYCLDGEPPHTQGSTGAGGVNRTL